MSHILGSFRQSLDRARTVTSVLCLATACLSLGALAGWAGGMVLLARGHTASGPMSPGASVYFLLLASALYVYNRNPSSRGARALAFVTGLLVCLFAAVSHVPLALPLAPGKGMWLHWKLVTPYHRLMFLWLGVSVSLCPFFARRRHWAGDMVGALILFFSLVNSIFILGYLHQMPFAFLPEDTASPPLLSSVNTLMLGVAVLARMGPRHFPLRLLSGSSVRAVLLRHFLPVTVASVLIFDLLEVSSQGRINAAVSSFLVILLSVLIVVYLSLRSSDVISRRIESSLKESEERYAVLVESLKEHAVLLLDPAGNVLTWNAGAERILGYRADEVLGDPVSRFLSPEESRSDGMEKTFVQAAAGSPHEEFGWRVRKGGARFWAETVTSPFFDQGGKVLGFSQVIRDVSVRKKAEEVVKEQTSFMRLLQAVTAACNGAETLEEALPMIIDQVCMHTQWPVGHAWLPAPEGEGLVSGPWHLSNPPRFTALHQEASKMRLMPNQGLAGKAYASGERRWAASLAEEKVFPRPQTARAARLASGFAFPLLVGKRVVAVLEFFSERTEDLSPSWREAIGTVCVQLTRVAEREESERALRSSEERFRSLTQTANDAIVSYDAEGVIAGWNRGARTIFGFEEKEVLGRPLSLLIAGGGEGGGGAGVPPVLLTDMSGKTVELVGRWKGGESFPIDVSVATWAAGGKVFFTAIIRDITAHKRIQDLLTTSLHEKEAMLKEIHHRVKNNLQMVSSLLRLQSEKIKDESVLSLFLESQNRVRSMAMIHESLYQSPDLARIDFSGYVDKLAGSLLRTYSLSPEPSKIELDVDRTPLSLDVAIPCGLIITELVSNALKYAYPEGKAGPVFVGFHALMDNRYELVVADKGVGIKGGVDFESTDSLGLRLVHILTEQLRGQVQVENGVGTKFVVTFKGPGARS